MKYLTLNIQRAYTNYFWLFNLQSDFVRGLIQLFKLNVKFIAILTVAAAIGILGCSTADTLPGENETEKPEIVDAVPDALFHWLSYELALDRGARVFSSSHEGYTYYVASAGNQSVVNGEIELVEKEKDSGHWSVKMEYYYPGVTERSSERHFMIIKVPEDTSIGVSLAAVTGVEQQAKDL